MAKVTAEAIVREAELNSTGTPDLLEILKVIPENTICAINLFLSEFDYVNNKTSNRAMAIRILAASVSALTRAIESPAEKPKKKKEVGAKE